MQGILQENLDLHDEILQRLLRTYLFGYGPRVLGWISSGAGKTVGPSGNGGGLGRARENVLQERRIDLTFQFRYALLVAIIVRVDIDETVQRVASFFHLADCEI